MEYLELIIVAVVAFYAGWRGATWLHLISFKKILEDMGVGEKELRNLAKKHDIKLPDEEGEESTITTHVEVKVEQHQGQLYCFEVENDRFVTQGKDPEELIEKLFAAYPKGTKINCEETNGGSLLKDTIKKMSAEAKTT
jgi:hypothetical protein